MPGCAVTTGQIALATWPVIRSGLKDGLLGRVGRCPSGYRGGSVFTLAIEQGTEYDGPVNVVAVEADQYLLADAWQRLPAHSPRGIPAGRAGAGLARGHAHPARGTIPLCLGKLPGKTDLDPTQRIAPQLIGPVGVFTLRANHDGTHRAGDCWPGIEARTGGIPQGDFLRGVCQQGAPGALAGQRFEALP
jgi:hypothetical protein